MLGGRFFVDTVYFLVGIEQTGLCQVNDSK